MYIIYFVSANREYVYLFFSQQHLAVAAVELHGHCNVAGAESKIDRPFRAVGRAQASAVFTAQAEACGHQNVTALGVARQLHGIFYSAVDAMLDVEFSGYAVCHIVGIGERRGDIFRCRVFHASSVEVMARFSLSVESLDGLSADACQCRRRDKQVGCVAQG